MNCSWIVAPRCYKFASLPSIDCRVLFHTIDNLPVIEVPYKMKEKIAKSKRTYKRNEQIRQKEKSRRGNLSNPIISCHNAKLNHYQGQSYGKFHTVPLASKGWLHRKSPGDHFTLNFHGGIPAITDDCPEDFGSLGISNDLVSALRDSGFKRPTNIQALAIPRVLKGINSLISAETGNGKTLAFLLPVLQQVAACQRALGNDSLRHNSPLALIVTPGRELAEQIQYVANEIGGRIGLISETIVGGHTKSLMLNPRLSFSHIVVGTIGAISKLTTTRVYNLSSVRHVVLDEADSLLDDSFNEQILHFLSRLQIVHKRHDPESNMQIIDHLGTQLTMASATTPRSLDKILKDVIEMDSLEKISTPYLHRVLPHIPQIFLRLTHAMKLEKLLRLVKSDQKRGVSTIVFSNKSNTSDFVSIFLNENSVPCVNMNGSMSADLRKGKFDKFQSGEVSVLSCTDLASRGLDTIRAGHVINFEFPKYMADYIHRCGRTGRVGSVKGGKVTSFIRLPHEVELTQKIEYAVRKLEDLPNVNANIKRIITYRSSPDNDVDEKPEDSENQPKPIEAVAEN